MKKRTILFVLAALLLIPLSAVSVAQAPAKAATLQTRCPVMGNPIDKKVYTDYEGKRVYFCCPMCVAKFKKDPEKYIKKMEAQGVTFVKAPLPQTRCPVMGTPVNKKVFLDYQGKRIYFCCKDCISKFKKAPEKYLKQMEAKGIAFAKTPVPQTRCPVTGEAIDKKVYTDYQGKRIYFCCKGCISRFLKNPAQYMGKLKQQGIQLSDVPGAKKAPVRGKGSGPMLLDMKAGSCCGGNGEKKDEQGSCCGGAGKKKGECGGPRVREAAK